MGPLRRLLALLAFATGIAGAAAHPMPNTLIEVGVSPRRLVFDLKIPLADVETVVFQTAGAAPEGDAPLPAFAILQRYFSEHLKVMGADGAFWPTGLLALDTLDIDDALSGPYAELHATVYAAPPPGADIRRFFLYYDAIMHQIVTHQAIVSIRRDWENGIYADADTTGARALAVIRVEPVTGEVLPVVVQLEKGSTWKGFTATFWLGMRHIAEGYDHLLFLLLLLVVAPLPAAERRWNGFGGWQFGLWRLLRIVTAFTVGHSLTLAICSLGWLRFSGRWVEVAIAFSILISAVHALRPLFFQREVWVAGAFGLVHGMAFSNILVQLDLDRAQLLWSLLGFNLGIEAVQLLIVALAGPVLFGLSRTRYYTVFRMSAGILGLLAALYWIGERV